MNYSPSLQNDDRGDAFGPGSSLQVLAPSGRSGLSVSPPIAPPHEPPTFDTAAERDHYHWLQTMAREDAKEIARKKEKRRKHNRKMMALLISMHTREA